MSVYDRIPSSFMAALTVLNGRQSRKIGFQTSLVRISEEVVALKHHNTYIVKYDYTGMEVDPNGYRSSTTKRRINKAIRNCGVQIFQKNWEWKVYNRKNDTTIPFVDGMIFEKAV